MSRTARIALLAVLGAVAATTLLVLISGGDDGYVVNARFADAAGLRQDFLVKIAGAPVGRVTHVGLGRGDVAVAKLKIDKGAAPIGAGARAAIRPSNLFGEKYIDLQPGDVRRPAPSGSSIPRTRTTTAPELDDLLDVLDADTRIALGVFLKEQGDALAGRGRDLASTLVRMPPALDEAQQLVDGLATDNRALGRLVETSDRTLQSVARERGAMGRFVAEAGGALDSFASRRQALGDTIRRAPAAIVQVRRSLDELERAAVPLGPAARGLRATAPPLEATLRELPAFTAAARPTLQTARAVGPQLGRLGAKATPVVQRLRPAASDLQSFSKSLEPVSALLEVGMPDALGVNEAWARAIQNRDAAGHVYRVQAELAGDAVVKLRNAFILGPKLKARKRKHGGAAPQHEASRPAAPHVDVPQVKVPALPRLPKLPGVPTVPNIPKVPEVPNVKVPDVKSPDLHGATKGSKDDSAGKLLDYLLGP